MNTFQAIIVVIGVVLWLAAGIGAGSAAYNGAAQNGGEATAGLAGAIVGGIVLFGGALVLLVLFRAMGIHS